jgi:hypothetical protein
LFPEQRGYVLAHEVGHALHKLAGKLSLKGIKEMRRELEPVYSTLNEPVEGLNRPVLPQHVGYTNEQAPYELVADAFRAYMIDPNYLKRVAPYSASVLRQWTNSHPTISKLIQFNSLGGLAVIGQGTDGEPDDGSGR